MPYDEPQGAPGAETPCHDQHPAKDTAARSRATVAPDVALRRRRGAAERLVPLASGVRDPLDELAGLPVGHAESLEYDVVDLGLTCDHSEQCPARGAA
jgi:hypothetical protein